MRSVYLCVIGFLGLGNFGLAVPPVKELPIGTCVASENFPENPFVTESVQWEHVFGPASVSGRVNPAPQMRKVVITEPAIKRSRSDESVTEKADASIEDREPACKRPRSAVRTEILDLTTEGGIAEALRRGAISVTPGISQRLYDCLKEIYIILVPLCEQLEAYAEQRPDGKPWEVGSYGPSNMRYCKVYLGVVRGDIGNSMFLPALKNSLLNGLLYLANEDVADRLKKFTNETRDFLKKYDLPTHEEEIHRLLQLADMLIIVSKEAQRSVPEDITELKTFLSE